MAINITIIGLDPLGESLGLALKNSPHPFTVTGHDRDHSRASELAKQGAIDRAEWNLISAVGSADLVFLNEPVYRIRETLEIIGPELRQDAVVTDTCSAKEVVLQWATELLPEGAHFVGGTPLVSVDHPSPHLFREQRYAIIPLPTSPETAVKLVADVVSVLGAEPFFIETIEHDSLMAAVRYLPAVSSAALIHLTTRSSAWREMEAMAGAGYARATALPSSDPANLATLLGYNREPLLNWIQALKQELDSLQELIMQEDDGKALEEHLTGVIEAQARWQAASTGHEASERYHKALDDAKEVGGWKHLFGLGRRRKGSEK
jgi:prephenate dehydrogenase